MIKLFNYLYDNFYDKEFASNKKQYLIQCSLATFIVFVVLMTLNLVASALVIASIASSSFVVFTMPHTVRSKTRYIVGGYIVGLSVGLLVYMLSITFIQYCPSLVDFRDEIFGALAVGFSIFFMVIFDVEHPPASSVSLAMVISPWNKWTIIVTAIAISLLILGRHAFRKRLINLL